MIILSKLECEKWACPIRTAMVGPHTHTHLYTNMVYAYGRENHTYRCHADKLLDNPHIQYNHILFHWFIVSKRSHTWICAKYTAVLCAAIAFQQQQQPTHLNTITCTRPAPHVSINTQQYERKMQFNIVNRTWVRFSSTSLSLSLSFCLRVLCISFFAIVRHFSRHCSPPSTLFLFTSSFLYIRVSLSLSLLPALSIIVMYVVNGRVCVVIGWREKKIEYNKKEKVNRNDLLKRFWTWLRK